jgi:hypothetical protein
MRLTAFAVAGAIVVSACADSSVAPLEPTLGVSGAAGGKAHVTVGADAGAGSFRDAIAAANADAGITHISFEKGLGIISLAEPVVFTGSQPLTIDGQGAVLDGSTLAGGESLLLATGGGNLDVRDVTVQNAPGSGIEVQVPGSSGGTLRYRLSGVVAVNNGLHGVVINDQVDPRSTEPPVRPNSAGSNAGLVVRVSQSRFEGNGFGAGDHDGLRINEGGLGSLDFEIKHSFVLASGGDGIELDERGPGDVAFSVLHTEIHRNGAMDPADQDDGLDVDELDEGHVIGRFVQVKANDNFEEGLDINENDAGDMRIEMNQVEASRNVEENIDLEEDDDYAGGGDLVVVMSNVTTNGMISGEGDAGLKIREKGAGHLDAYVENPVANANGLGGISVREDADGNLTVEIVNPVTNANVANGILYDERGAGTLTGTIRNATASGNGINGVFFDERGDGDLLGSLLTATASNNGNAGVRAREDNAGDGTLTIQALTAIGNTAGTVVTNATLTVIVLP